MRTRESKRVTKTVLECLQNHLEDDLRGADDRELMDDCFGKIALHYVSHYEGEDLSDVDVWDLKVEGFEAGLKAVERLRPGQKVYSVYIHPDDIDTSGGHSTIDNIWCLWFAAKNDHELVRNLKAAYKIYLKIWSVENARTIEG